VSVARRDARRGSGRLRGVYRLAGRPGASTHPREVGGDTIGDRRAASDRRSGSASTPYLHAHCGRDEQGAEKHEAFVSALLGDRARPARSPLQSAHHVREHRDNADECLAPGLALRRSSYLEPHSEGSGRARRLGYGCSRSGLAHRDAELGFEMGHDVLG
jgi:hypothetical protein